jgi:hypothetical protein
MKYFLFFVLFVIAFSNSGESTVLVADPKPLLNLYAAYSPNALSKLSIREMEHQIGRKLTKVEIVEFRQERQKARKKTKKPLFGKEGGFPWWSLILAVLSIVVLLVVVL